MDRAAPPVKWQPSFKFFFNHEATPLKLTFPDQYGDQDIISSAQVFNLQAQFAITKWMEVALDVPIVRHSMISGPTEENPKGFDLLIRDDLASNIPASDVSPLDMRVGFRFNLLHTGGLGLALAVQGTLPFGDEELFAGENDPTLQPRLIASLDKGAFGLAANVGYRIRKQSIVLYDVIEAADDPQEAERPLLAIDDELTFGIGAAYAFHRYVGVGVEFYGAAPLTTESYEVVTEQVVVDPNDPNKTPGIRRTTENVDLQTSMVTEVLGGIIFRPVVGMSIAVGAGAGTTGDERQVTYRLFGGVSWMPGAEAPSIGVRDQDGDGIPDFKDECPSRAEDKDGYEDEDGCPEPDNDGDGVLDASDKCPDKAEDKDGYEDEDGCPDQDNDGDGIPDADDKCPDKAEDKDAFQDEDGCPDLDNDGDGIADASDKCPNEPETLNGFQDEDGCPDSVPTGVAVGKGMITIPEQIRFKRGSSVIVKKSYNLLNEIAKKIRENPQIGRIRIEGHCDNTGTADANRKLSQGRSESVRSYLVRRGVRADRLQAVGYGSDRPIAPNTTKEGRTKNRRVEFVIIQKKDE